MGDKALAKRRMLAAGVPCAPGYLGDEQGDATPGRRSRRRSAFRCSSRRWPAAAGAACGWCARMDELAAAIAGARREAQSAFGDGTLMLERLIEDGRHIEIQVFADAHGNAIHLGERDCTAQRRRQKVIEEAPSPVVSAGDARGDGARRGRRRAGGRLRRRRHGRVHRRRRSCKHYFLEMNTRLQVEHPVTEMRHRARPRRVAAARRRRRAAAAARRKQIALRRPRDRGAAVRRGSVRRASRRRPGRVAWLAARGGDRAVRACASTTASPKAARSSPYYDAMVAKLIAHGRDRDDAIRRLRAALVDAPLLGLRNNGRFLARPARPPGVPRRDDARRRALDEWVAAGRAACCNGRSRPTTAWCVAAAALADARRQAGAPDSVAAYDLALECDERATTPARAIAARRPHRRRMAHDAPRCACATGRRPAALSRSTACSGARSRVVRSDELHLALDGASFVFIEPSPCHCARCRRRRAPRAARRWPASWRRCSVQTGRHGGGRAAAGLRRGHEDGDVAQRRRRRHACAQCTCSPASRSPPARCWSNSSSTRRQPDAMTRTTRPS